jgi:hypothetical protein
MSAEKSLNKDKNLKLFAELSANVLGLRLLGLAGKSNELGASLGKLSPKFGVEWEFNKNVTVELTLLGADFQATKFKNKTGTDLNTYSKLEIMVKETYGLFCKLMTEHQFGQEKEKYLQFGLSFHFN